MPGTQRLALRQNGLPCDRRMDRMRRMNLVNRFWNVTLAAAAVLAISAAGITLGHAEEEGIDKAKAAAFDARMFTKPPGKQGLCLLRAPL